VRRALYLEKMEESDAPPRLTVEFRKQDTGPPVFMAKQIIDDSTIEACRRGDSDALQLVFETYRDRVYSIALCYFDGDEAAAKDITQDVFLKLMTAITQFENRSQFSTWLYRVVTNACLDRHRSFRRLLFFADVPAGTRRAQSAEDRYIQNELETSVRKVIAGMQPKLRMAILLKYFEDLSYDEMAVVLGCSRGTVASRLNRAHQILARKLAHLRGTLPSGASDV